MEFLLAFSFRALLSYIVAYSEKTLTVKSQGGAEVFYFVSDRPQYMDPDMRSMHNLVLKHKSEIWSILTEEIINFV